MHACAAAMAATQRRPGSPSAEASGLPGLQGSLTKCTSIHIYPSSYACRWKFRSVDPSKRSVRNSASSLLTPGSSPAPIAQGGTRG